MDAPTYPTFSAPRRRLTRIALAATLSLLALTLIAWVVGEFYVISISRKSGEFVPPSATDTWVFRAQTLRFAQVPGELQLGWREYRSVAPTRDGLDQWNTWHGWHLDFAPTKTMHVAAEPNFAWYAPDDFAFCGAGIVHVTKFEEARGVFVSHWMLALILASIITALWLPAHRRARRLRNHQCPRCAYDLRATPATAPCPECGLSSEAPTRPMDAEAEARGVRSLGSARP